jgi:hypothetical protein
MIVRKIRAATIASVLGTVAILAWGMLFWEFLYQPLGVFQEKPVDPVLVEALNVSGLETGTYLYPWPRDTPDAKRDWVSRHAAGPFFRLSYVREGVDPESPWKLGFGVLHNLLVASMATGLILLAGRGSGTFGARFLIVTLAGMMGTVLIQAGETVWFHMPLDYVIGAAFYQIVCWLLLAGILAAYLTSTRMAGE